MKHILSPAGKARLAKMLRARCLLAFDYDGTLAPIRRRTIEAFLPKTTHELWTALCRRHPCAVISGRGLADLRFRMAGAGPCVLIGNHGMEPEGPLSPRATEWAALTRAWLRELRPALSRYPGVELEGKRWSMSVHWRAAPNARGLTQRIRTVAKTLPGARLIGGKKVLNIVPADAPNKGDAVRTAMRRRRCAHALFVGDDVTDEDGFALAGEVPLVGVRVGSAPRTQAAFALSDQGEINALLRWLLEASAATPRTGGLFPTDRTERRSRSPA